MRMVSASITQKLFEILALINYNGERLEPLEVVLRNFISLKDENFDPLLKTRQYFETEVKKWEAESKNVQETGHISKSNWFKQKTLLCANIPRSYVPSYLASKYFPFSREFEEKYKLPVDSLLSFSLGSMSR